MKGKYMYVKANIVLIEEDGKTNKKGLKTVYIEKFSEILVLSMNHILIINVFHGDIRRSSICLNEKKNSLPHLKWRKAPSTIQLQRH